jgi:hypothetical protein
MEEINPSPGKLKQIKLARISISGESPDDTPEAGQAVIVNEQKDGLAFGSAVGAGGGGGYTGYHDYGSVGTGVGTVWFTGNFAHSFATLNVTGNINITATGMETGASMLIHTTCPTGNIVGFHDDIGFIGAKPTSLPSGATGLFVFTSFNSGLGNLEMGHAFGGISPSGVVCGYGVQDI